MRVKLVSIAIVLVALTAIGTLAWADLRPPLMVGVARNGPPSITNEMFARLRDGMRPEAVAAVLGRPVRRTESLAEGYAWPEPKDMCWYYPSIGGLREYQVCFIAWRLVTRGSYPVTGGEPG